MKRKRIITIAICVAGVLAIVGTTLGVSLAYWRENKHASLYVEFPLEDENPSLKYQMMVPVRATGYSTDATHSAYERIAGSFSVEAGNYSYTLANAADIDNIDGFALAGWYGGVALEYIEIPAEITVKINGTQITKPVLRVMVDADFGDYSFGGVNTAIRTIIVGSNVTEVDQAAFFGMASLETLRFIYSEDNNDYLYLRPYSFGGCPKLVSITNPRPADEDWNNSAAFEGSGPQV